MPLTPTFCKLFALILVLWTCTMNVKWVLSCIVLDACVSLKIEFVYYLKTSKCYARYDVVPSCWRLSTPKRIRLEICLTGAQEEQPLLISQRNYFGGTYCKSSLQSWAQVLPCYKNFGMSLAGNKSSSKSFFFIAGDSACASTASLNYQAFNIQVHIGLSYICC